MIKLSAITIYLFTILFAASLSAQEFSQNYWHDGEVYLKNNSKEPLIGSLQYKLESDQIQLIVGKNRMKTFHASQLSYVKFTDKLEGTFRHFFALPITDQQGYQRMQLFELLIEGQVSLLSREKIVNRVQHVNDPFRPYGANYTTTILEETYYLADLKGEIKEVSRRKSEPAWQAFPDLKAEMKTYFEQEKIDVLYRDEMFKLVTYYNRLKTAK